MASTGISNKMVCSQGPWMVMSISPEGSAVTWMYFSFSLNSPKKSTKSLLMKRSERRYCSSDSLKVRLHKERISCRISLTNGASATPGLRHLNLYSTCAPGNWCSTTCIMVNL